MTDIALLHPARAMPDRLKAVLLMCSAVTLFSGLDTTAKYLGSHSGPADGGDRVDALSSARCC